MRHLLPEKCNRNREMGHTLRYVCRKHACEWEALTELHRAESISLISNPLNRLAE